MKNFYDCSIMLWFYYKARYFAINLHPIIIINTSSNDVKDYLAGVITKLWLMRREAGTELVTLHLTTCST